MAIIKPNKSIKTYPDLFAQYHETYTLTDDRRRKAFYHVWFSIALLLIVIFDPPTGKDSYTVFGLEIGLQTVEYSVPFLVLFLYLRYVYLSAHALKSLVFYLITLRANISEPVNQAIPLSDLYSAFQRRDFNEHLNIFLFPRRTSSFKAIINKRKKKGFKFVIERLIVNKILISIGANFVNLAANFIPPGLFICFFFYMKYTHWLIITIQIIALLLVFGYLIYNYRLTHDQRKILFEDIYRKLAKEKDQA